MPKKASMDSQAGQSARFCAEVEKLLSVGELNLIAADERLERALTKARVPAPVGVHQPRSRRT